MNLVYTCMLIDSCKLHESRKQLLLNRLLKSLNILLIKQIHRDELVILLQCFTMLILRYFNCTDYFTICLVIELFHVYSMITFFIPHDFS